MTNIESLKIVKAALLEKKGKIQEAIASHEEAFGHEKKALWETVFQPELDTYLEVDVVAGKGWVRFSVGNKEIASISCKGYKNDEFYFNTYSTFIESEFEYKRLIFNGKIAEKILFNQESILEVFKTGYSKAEELESLYEQQYAIEKEIRCKDLDMIEVRKQEVIDKLYGEGMEFNVNKVFEFARNFRNYSVKKVRVNHATKSGKTVDLEVTYAVIDWSYDEEGRSTQTEREDRVVIYEGIKMDYVLGNFRDYIYN